MDTQKITPEISVIVPVYKTEKFLPACVESVLAQTFRNFELILVDDGSPDKCPELCDKYAESDVRIRVVHQSNQGIATARNNGCKISTGKWIFFVDSDDMISPYCLEYLYRAVTENGVKMAVCGTKTGSDHPYYFPKDPIPVFDFDVICTTDDAQIKYQMHNQYFTKTAWAKLTARECILENLFPDGRIYEDNAVVPKWLACVHAVAYSDIPLYYYYINPHGIVRQKYSLKQTDNVWAKRIRLQIYKDMGCPEMARYAFEEYILAAAVAYSQCIKELRELTAARAIKAEFVKVYIPNMKLDHMSAAQRFTIFECFHPSLANIYYLTKVLKRKIMNFLKK